MPSAPQDKRRDPASPDSGDDRRERILRTAKRLFAERGFRNVSVRDIAAEAGVTHPLIYYHWSSKEELLAAILERTQRRSRTVAKGDGLAGIGEALAREYVHNNREYLLTITRAFIDGAPASEWPGGFPGIEALLAEGKARLGPRGDRVLRERVAVATALLNGWVLIEDQLLEMTGLDPGARESARGTMVRCIGEILAGAEECVTHESSAG